VMLFILRLVGLTQRGVILNTLLLKFMEKQFIHNGTEMNDGVYFDQNGSEVIVINGFEYSREEFDFLVDMCGDCNM